MINVTDYGGLATIGQQKAKAAEEANEFCQKRGKIMVPDSEWGEDVSPGRHGASATFVFRCLREGDPDLQRPQMRPPPDVTIEDER